MKYALAHAYCLNILPSMEEYPIDLIFFAPLYNVSNGGTMLINTGERISVNKTDLGKSSEFNKDTPSYETWIKKIRRILKQESEIWISGISQNISQYGHLLQKLNFHILSYIVWNKHYASPNLTCNVFACNHETILRTKKDEKAKQTLNYKAIDDGYFEKNKLIW